MLSCILVLPPFSSLVFQVVFFSKCRRVLGFPLGQGSLMEWGLRSREKGAIKNTPRNGGTYLGGLEQGHFPLAKTKQEERAIPIAK